jgi:hypothetical protein
MKLQTKLTFVLLKVSAGPGRRSRGAPKPRQNAPRPLAPAARAVEFA